MTSITRAEPLHSQALTDLAVQSEAYWGYDNDFMERFKTLYRVSEAFIGTNPTFILCSEEEILGFYSIVPEEPEPSLEFFYIAPAHIGKGCGKVMWRHMLETCEAMGISGLNIVTSPQAKEFYLKMGAVYTGEVDSLVVEGRKIPKLIYTLDKKS